jgi:valyl-tRNA synthetase
MKHESKPNSSHTIENRSQKDQTTVVTTPPNVRGSRQHAGHVIHFYD